MLSNSCGVIVNNNHTDIVVNIYQNRLFIVVSQYRKLGSFVSVTKDSILHEYNKDVYNTKVMFGKDDSEIHAAARYIAQEINIDRPLLISICLKDFEVSTIRTIAKAINKIKLQI